MARAVMPGAVLAVFFCAAQACAQGVAGVGGEDVAGEAVAVNAALEGAAEESPQPTTEEFTDRIQGLLEDGDFAGADALLGEKIRDYPEQKRLRLLQAASYARQERWDAFFDEVKTMSALEAVSAAEEEDLRREEERWFSIVYDEGILQAREGRFEEAFGLLDRLAENNYRGRTWQADKIVIMTWQKQFNEAIKEFEGLGPDDPKPDYLLNAMVDAYRSTGKEPELLEVYARILELGPPQEEQYRLSASRTAISVGDMERAREYTEALLEADPGNTVYILQMAEIFARDDNYLRAWELISSIPDGDAAEALDRIKAVLDALTDIQAAALVKAMLSEDSGRDLTVPQGLLVVSHFARPVADFSNYVLLSSRVQRMFARFPLPLQVEVAALMFDHGMADEAVEYYTAILRAQPDHFEARYKLAEIYFSLKDDERALEYIEAALAGHPDHFDALFLRGKILDRAGRYWESVKNYEQLLKYYPDNKAAKSLKYRALMDVGAATLVTDAPDDEKEDIDEVIMMRARGDRAMQRIHWDEPVAALGELNAVVGQYAARELAVGNRQEGEGPDRERAEMEAENYRRARWDRILAMRPVLFMEEIIREYVRAKDEGVEIPFWIHEAAGDAYLYEEQPETALAIYDGILKDAPKSYNARFAKYYALIELECYGEAAALLEELDRDTPKETTERGVVDDNWKKADIAANKAWLLMYQDRLKEAEVYLRGILDIAPANTNLRVAEAQSHLWRGWPRRSLEDFRIVRTMDPRHAGGNIGHALALNTNMQKAEARGQIDAVLNENPKNKHALRAKRLFHIEDMTLLTVDAQFMEEFPGEDEFQFTVRLDEPVTRHHTLWGYWLRRETTDFAGNDVTTRVYAGDRWRPNNTWQLTGGLAFDTEGDADTGYLADLVYTPDDFWRFGAGYETQIISVPLRSRAAGVSADQLSLSAAFRASEGFNTALDFSFVDFTDGNENHNYLWTTDTVLTTRARWKTRLGTEFGYSSYSRQDVDYFSPERGYSLYLVPMAEHVWFRRYERGLVDRLYVGLGGNWQKGFGGLWQNFVRYEQDYKFSETKRWLVGVRYDLKQYDGEDVNTLKFYTTLRLNF